MPNNTPRPNDSANYSERVKKTISNMEAAEEAMKSAEGKELASIKEKNARRENSLSDLSNEKDKKRN
ncbi:small, acid-soluble spore protein tlp [Sporosarcina sp. G11-34]|uniref:small, acid-soluble spore protein tlp n=1 Tax=Sporosarcina sp. G11-34 TaxID=2849605 RepID=UPI0022A9A495|nr:small, acid-soluble spore protein tlp [Sporosarcina sp. G11-34]MCZ2260498.1 small, acid-soluble spore protein tlp [Sporosarcina sp. G11-34]